MKRSQIVMLLLGSCAFTNQVVLAQNPRQAARQERREARQELRVNDRSAYFTDQTWTQLNPWVTRNNVQPVPATRVGAAVNAAANTAQRAADAAANTAQRAANAAENTVERAANATANAAAGTANSIAAGVNSGVNAAAAANARYGYSSTNASSPQGWFYDYYSYSPTFYSAPASGSNYYARASRYYDYNNDGIYDSLSTYRDADKSGSFQAYDQLDFSTVKNDANDRSSEYVSDAQRHTVSGTVEATKFAKVNGSENLIVRISSSDRNSDAVIVDLGPADRWKSQSQVREGDKLTASGPMEQVGDKNVLIAESVAIGQQKEILISRSGPTIEGQVVDVTGLQSKAPSMLWL